MRKQSAVLISQTLLYSLACDGYKGDHLHEPLCLIMFLKNLDTDLEHLHEPPGLMHCKFNYLSILAEAMLVI